MDVKTEIKEEDCMSDDIGSQNEREFFHKVVTMRTNSDAVLLDDDCDVTIKTEIKSETPFTKHLEHQIKCEIMTCSDNWETDRQTDLCSQSEREFLPEDPVTKDDKYNSGHEMINKMEVKEESWCLKTETSTVYVDIKAGDFLPVKSSRLCTEAVSGDSSVKSPLLSAVVSGRDTGFCNGRDCPVYERQQSDVTVMPTAEEHAASEQTDKCTDVGEVHSKALHMKQKNLFCKNKKSYQCETCDKSFTWLSALKIHNLIHAGKKPHQCKTCDKAFTRLSHLKAHTLIHEGIKVHQCKTCNKNFTQLSYLKTHNLIHEGKKHQCKSCDKSFTLLGNLKIHNMIHEGNKPHQCKTCDKSFTSLSALKTHYLIHEGKKSHQCKTCEKSFTQLSHLKTHNLIHEGRKPYQCKTCGKSFSRLFHLKTHNLIHEGKKAYQCKICDKGFTQKSHLKTHNLIHEDKKLQ